MKMESKFAVGIAILGLAIILFSAYQWQYFDSLAKYSQYPDVSQFWVGIIIGGILILYARNEWNRARDTRNSREYEKQHDLYHKKLTEQQDQIRNEYQEVKQLANDVQLRMVESNS